MSGLVWNAVGERIFETGVEKGVLYVDGADGVAWNGLVAVSESSSGGDATPYYVDGIKYLNRVAAEEFEATIEAYTYPDEFGQCDGTVPVKNGLFATRQPKKSFGLSYQTKIGNDVDTINHGYKIHLVYGATAAPTDKHHASIGDSISPDNFSWKVVTKPPTFTGYKPTAHFVIDSREVPSGLMNEITAILYGSSNAAARLPSVPELLYLFNEYEASFFDGGEVVDPTPYFGTFDRGSTPGVIQTSTLDGGTP